MDSARASLPVVLLMGPTASGKSALALALAERFPVEIVSVDSAQIYEGMDIGTAKPDAATRARVPHHLIDVIPPTERYSAAQFVVDASSAIAGIRSRGRIPLLVGGTMLYFKTLREGLSALPSASPAIRAEIEARAAASGWPVLHAELVRVDPVIAARLDPCDAQRIQRALEVFALTGTPLSSLQGRRHAVDDAQSMLALALLPPDRASLHASIGRRFDAMLDMGLVQEVQMLRERYQLDADLPSMRCVGYRQVWQYIEGELDRTELRSKGIAATRQLAKRQYTWLRSMPALALDADSPTLLDDATKQIAARPRCT